MDSKNIERANTNIVDDIKTIINEGRAIAYSAPQLPNQFVNDIRQIITTAQTNAVRSVDFCRVQMYWNMGRRILEEEQKGKARADYGTYLLENLAKHLEPEFGSGFGVRQLKFCRQFYKEYPIGNALRSQLNWSQYRMLIQIPDHDKREYYELEAVNNAWTACQQKSN